jgi:hypothetical protein
MRFSILPRWTHRSSAQPFQLVETLRRAPLWHQNQLALETYDPAKAYACDADKRITILNKAIKWNPFDE